jgi:hypothetical protein
MTNSPAMKRMTLASGLVIGLTVAAILFFFDPVRVPIYPVCLFHQLTGLDCPGCGSLRALHELLHGNLATALHFNAFLVLSLPLFACLGLGFVWRKVHHQPGVKIRPVWFWVYLAAFVTFGLLRELPIPFLTAFAP